jgi:hypothetical protein
VVAYAQTNTAANGVEGCATCHGGAGEALSVGCHKVGDSGGNPHAGFNSRRPKTQRPCRLCHESG